MQINKRFLFLSLFQKDSSGTISLIFPKHKLEIDIKHALDWDIPFFLSLKDKSMFIPMPFGCRGLRFLFYKRAK